MHANDTILSLQEYLTRIAHNIVTNYYPQFSPDDVLQEMNTYILERGQKEPEFLNQTPGYITRAAAWRVRDWCRDQQVGRMVDIPEDILTNDSASVDDEIDAARIAAAVQTIIAGLAGRDQEIARAMLAGQKRQDIARAYGIKSPTLQGTINRIKAALAPAYEMARG